VYGTHNAPHDIQVRELGSGKSRLETAAALGIRFHIVPRLDIADGIDAARAFIARCWFDAATTERGRPRPRLAGYHKNDGTKALLSSHRSVVSSRAVAIGRPRSVVAASNQHRAIKARAASIPSAMSSRGTMWNLMPRAAAVSSRDLPEPSSRTWNRAAHYGCRTRSRDPANARAYQGKPSPECSR